MFVFAGAMSPLIWFFEVLAIIAFGMEGFALIDAVRRPRAAFLAAGKQTKTIWMLILGVATVVGLAYCTVLGGVLAIGILPIVAFVAAAIYLTDVRPKVREFGGGSRGSQHMGPYGPW